MQWVRMHPYSAALAAAGILILVGAYIVEQRTAVNAAGSTRAWGGVGGNLLSPISNARFSDNTGNPNQYMPVQNNAPLYYNIAPVTETSQSGKTADNFDLAGFLASLAHGGKTSGNVNANDSLNAYSFIPGGLISTSSPYENRTPAQQELFDYGNEAGSDIQGFEDTHRNIPQVLKDQFEDRQNPAKNAALIELARALSGVGDQLLNIDPMPVSVAGENKTLAESYRNMGNKLSKIPDAKTDQDLLNAITAYDAAADTFIKNYSALATFFSISGVTFGSNDPGNVFMFTAASL